MPFAIVATISIASAHLYDTVFLPFITGIKTLQAHIQSTEPTPSIKEHIKAQQLKTIAKIFIFAPLFLGEFCSSWAGIKVGLVGKLKGLFVCSFWKKESVKLSFKDSSTSAPDCSCS